MRRADWRSVLEAANAEAIAFLDAIPERPVGPQASVEELRAALDGSLPDEPVDAVEVVRELAAVGSRGAIAIPSGRFFGFVIGGSTPAALAADWLATAWDQNAGLYVAGPAAAVCEEVAGRWVADLLGLPDGVSVGFVTGGQMANYTCLAAARHDVLRRAGWDVETQGLIGAPPLRVLAGAERHGTIDRALRFLGIGTDRIEPVAVDRQGRMRPDALADALAGAEEPAIVCAQVGNVNSGAIDRVDEIAAVAHRAGAWVHVDGAFGLWAAASDHRHHHVDGVAAADSWATDAHKWLNVPYDSGLAFTAHPEAHRAAMSVDAAYLMPSTHGERDAMDWNPEFSRRARGVAVYAGLRALGRRGVAELVDRCCDLAARFADQLGATDGVEVLNEVVLNQVLVRFDAPDGDHDAHTRAVVARVQDEGTCWMSPTTWRGTAAMRISVSNWSTDEDDVDRSVAAVLRAARA
jgi:glutamate/tyrosine decarboxylase-like PLP-dependent enzyme